MEMDFWLDFKEKLKTMKLIQYNDCFTAENIFQDGTSVIVILDNKFSQNEKFVETWFADCDNVHPTNYGFYIDDCTFEEVEMGRRADHVEWEEINERREYAETRKVVLLSFKRTEKIMYWEGEPVKVNGREMNHPDYGDVSYITRFAASDPKQNGYHTVSTFVLSKY